MTGREAPIARWPLIGRDEIVRDAASILGRGKASGVVLVGAEGVGKSRLAAEVLRHVASRGMSVRSTVATVAAATLPFGALADLLPPDLERAASPFELMRFAAQELRAKTPQRGVVVAVDDAHLLDDGSASLIAHAIRSGAARGLIVLREAEPASDALIALLKDGPCEQLRVEPLVADEVERLCTAVLGGHVEGATLRRLDQLSAGNLLYLHELIDAARQDGTLRQEGGVWCSRDTPIASQRLSQIVEARLSRQEGTLRSVPEITALAGTVELTLLERLTSTEAVIRAERAGLVSVTEDGRRLRVHVSSPLYAEVLRSSMPRSAGRHYHQRLATALAATGRRRADDTLRYTRYLLEAGITPENRLLLSAARSAQHRFDVHLAVRLTAAAARNGGDFDVRLAAAEALYAAGSCAEAERDLLALESEADDQVQRARVALVRASNLVSGFGRAVEAEALIQSVRQALGDGDLRDELAALAGMIALSCGRAQQALNEVEPLLARPDVPERTAVRALLVATSAWGQVGRADAAIEAGERVLLPSSDRDLPVVVEGVLVGLCYALGVSGRLGEAEELARSRYAAALDQSAADLRTLWALALGQAAVSRGQLLRAEGHLREAALLLRQDQSIFGVYSLAWSLGCLAEAAASAGDAKGSRAALDEAYAVTPEPCFIASRELARIWVTWVEEASDTAAAVAIEVARQANELGMYAVEGVALHQVARLGSASEITARLDALAEQVDGDLIPAHADHARALVQADPDLLAAASRTYERLGVWLDAAEAEAQASREYARSGRRTEAARAAHRSSGLAARCPGARTPGLVLAAGPQQLTAREREVAGLAARGWTTARIADTLVVSARTVDNHLHNAYTKLGISSRSELSEVLSGSAPN